MESAAFMRSFSCSVGTISPVRSVIERHCETAVSNVSWPTLRKSHIQGFTFGTKLVSYLVKREGMVVSCAKASETIAAAAADSDVPSDGKQEGLSPKNSLQRATFPDGFEALILSVCDETEIAELKVKVGDFEMHLKRNVGATNASMPVLSPTAPPHITSEPMMESAPTSPESLPPKSSTETVSPFTNVSAEKSAKLAALEASGSSGYVIVSSPTVGSFRRGRTVKGKKHPPICKEGSFIKEGQVVGFVDQFGTELPVKSNVAGEVLRILLDDAEAVGYGDPLIAVLPSFHGIE